MHFTCPKGNVTFNVVSEPPHHPSTASCFPAPSVNLSESLPNARRSQTSTDIFERGSYNLQSKVKQRYNNGHKRGIGVRGLRGLCSWACSPIKWEVCRGRGGSSRQRSAKLVCPVKSWLDSWELEKLNLAPKWNNVFLCQFLSFPPIVLFPQIQYEIFYELIRKRSRTKQKIRSSNSKDVQLFHIFYFIPFNGIQCYSTPDVSNSDTVSL